MKEDFEKVNDYTLAVKLSLDSSSSDYSEGKFQLTRIFNFESGQVTTLARDWLHQRRGTQSGGSSATGLQMSVQNFSDLESQSELEIMHRRLTSLGGKPPALDAIVSTLGKTKKLGSTP